jgi:prepilin-type N-terminal cleavage/methylation domain-containing protein
MASKLQRRRHQVNFKMRRSYGFSLIELLIVVAVILILAVIAVPNLIRSRIAANEASAAGTIRQISLAEMSYHISYTAVGFAPDLPSLGGPVGCLPSQAHACILDSQITTGTKNGYQFFAAGFLGADGTNTTFVASSAPLSFNHSGVRLFCIATDDGVLRAKPGALGVPPAPDVPTCVAYPLM